jgi:hypothetical protein
MTGAPSSPPVPSAPWHWAQPAAAGSVLSLEKMISPKWRSSSSCSTAIAS